MTLRTFTAVGTALFLFTGLAAAQDKKLACKDDSDGNRHRVCEMREMTLAPGGMLEVDAGPNGGISVTGWQKNEVFVRAKVEAWGDSDAEAKDRLTQVKIETATGRVKAEGPRAITGKQEWSVSYEVFAPAKSDLKLDTVNGGISVGNVRGVISMNAVNGGLSLARTGGKVRAHTVNGGIRAELEGSQWDGEGLDLDTVNGGINVTVPAAYNARFETRTVNGGLGVDFEGVTVKGTWGSRKADFNVGSGGQPIKAQTVNGGVKIRKQA